MNIYLETNSQSKRLKFQNIKKIGRDYECFLIAESRGFCAARFFYFDEYYLKLFLEKIIEMDLKFEGQAVLKNEFEDDQISIVCEKTGHIIVSSSLFEHSEYSQNLTFCFQTDQTVFETFNTRFLKVE